MTAVILILFICLWSTLYLSRQIDIDMAWLLQCLERFLAGGTYAKDFYETNPPLSFLIYLPGYPLYALLGYDAKLSAFFAFTLYMAVSTLTFCYLLHRLGIKASDIFVIICAYLISQTWPAALSFGSKDSLITMFLAPMLLYQYLITQNIKLNKISHAAAIIMGGVAVSLKPHYSVLVAMMFIHRLYSTKSIKRCIISPDFLGMLMFGIGYLTFIWLYTPTFFDILPDILDIYGVETPFPITDRLYYALYGIGGLVVGFYLLNSPEQKNLQKATICFAALCLVSLIPYLLQNKGYHYHALPTLCYGFSAVFMGVYAITKNITKERDYAIIAGICVITCLTFVNTVGGKDKHPYTKHQYLAQPIPSMIDDYAWNDVFATYDLKSMLTPLPYITSVKNGSRFGQVWPISGLNVKLKTAKTEEEQDKIKKRMVEYVNMMVEDIHRYKPSVITIPRYNDPKTNEPAQNYYNFLMKNENFSKAMENYEYESTLPFDNTLTTNANKPDKIVQHDLFVLKRDHSL